MRATTNTILPSVVPDVKLEHKGETLSFCISVFQRANFQGDYDVFGYINQYWESLPMGKQDQIFSIYKEIEYGFDTVFSKNELFDYLQIKVADLIHAHDLDTIQDWVALKSDIQIPSSFEGDYEHSIDNNTSREKTYTRADYSRLVALSVLLRCMVPVWGEYIANIRQETGTMYKEFIAFQLINKSNISHCVPMAKLQEYIEHIVGADNFDANNILNGICAEDFGFYLLSLVCIRRLCIGDTRGVDPRTNLITFIYKFIIQRIRNNDNNYENVVKEKTFDDRSPDGENKISTLERYKIKTTVSLGEIVELEYSLRNIIDSANRLSYMVDPYIIQRSLQTSKELMNQKLFDPQMTLLRWIFKPVISPKGLMYLPKPMIVQAIAAMEAVLWARGHKYLAILSSSYALTNEKEMVISPVDSKTRVPAELLKELDTYYPFTRTVNGKKTGLKVINLAAKAIDTVADNLSLCSWRTTADESMLQEVLGNTNRRLPIKPDIKIDLTKLVIEIGSRTAS
jgi:hypothetical protein